jgi:GrpB-like predicted nucleotidyltransferase (UPF0157 family)
MKKIIIKDYDPEWPSIFDSIYRFIWPHIMGQAISIEHVGSTSVSGLAAKPIIDIDIIVDSQDSSSSVIKSLVTLGYKHRGDLGITDREAFTNPSNLSNHNLYVCLNRSLALRNHLALRDFLRSHPDSAVEYGKLKKKLVSRYKNDIDAYVEGKTEFIIGLLKNSGFTNMELSKISGVNKKK